MHAMLNLGCLIGLAFITRALVASRLRDSLSRALGRNEVRHLSINSLSHYQNSQPLQGAQHPVAALSPPLFRSLHTVQDTAYQDKLTIELRQARESVDIVRGRP